MNDAWKTSLSESFGKAFDGFDRALHDCPDALWEECLWEVPELPFHGKPWPAGALLGAERPEAERRHVLSAFWFIVWHVVDCLHYDLEGVPMPEWRPPPPFSASGDPTAIDWDYYLPKRVFTRIELQAYVADTRHKAEVIVGGLTDEQIARPIAVGHRHSGISYASLLLGCLTHSNQHLAQLDLFLGQRGVIRT